MLIAYRQRHRKPQQHFLQDHRLTAYGTKTQETPTAFPTDHSISCKDHRLTAYGTKTQETPTAFPADHRRPTVSYGTEYTVQNTDFYKFV